VPAKSTPKKPASEPEAAAKARAGKSKPADPPPAPAEAAHAPTEPADPPPTPAEAAHAPTETAEALAPEPLNRAERRAARRKGGTPPLTAVPPSKVGRGTQVRAPRQWANRRSG
jgi:hypothetical protein